MATESYNVLVIGSGGGSKIIRPAANLGLSVCLIEKGPFGGTCLNSGCIPSKMLIHPADIISTIEGANCFEIQVSTPSIDKHKLVDRVCQEIDAESASIGPLYDKSKVKVHRGACHFVSSRCVEVNGILVTADYIFVVAGCRAKVPDIPGLLGTPYITYSAALRLKETPKTAIVIGGGYIAVELGYFFAKTGTKVDFLVRSKLLATLDDTVGQVFRSDFSKSHSIHLEAVPINVSYDGMFHVTVQFPNEQKVMTCDCLFVAAGVQSQTDLLRMHEHGYQVDNIGLLKVDGAFRTSVKNVWAFGDIIGNPMFRHTANYQGEWVFKNVFKNPTHSIDDVYDKSQSVISYPPIPFAVFTNPQIGGVGLTEKEAIAAYSKLVIGVSEYQDIAMGNACLVKSGICKLIFKASDHVLVGAHIIGPEASTLIHMLIAYMRCNATLEIILDTIFIHPAFGELIRDAARDARDNLNH